MQAPAWESTEQLFSPEPNPTAPRSEDPSGLLRIPQVLRRMYNVGWCVSYFAIPGMVRHPPPRCACIYINLPGY